MKRLKYIFLLLCGVFTLWSCSNNELPDGSVGNISAQPFTITIGDSGFRSDDNVQTRTVNNYQTVFTAGDKIGLFAVKDYDFVEEIKNISLTAVRNDDTGGIDWVVDDGKQLLSDVTYFAYFPYVSSFSFSVDDYIDPDQDEDANYFFNYLINNEEPDTDQNTYEKCKLQDWMIAKGVFTENVLSLSMEHIRSLVVLDLPITKPALSGEIIDAPNTHFVNFSPYRMDDGKYYYLINYSDRLVGGYTNADGVNVKWLIEPRMDYGYYHVYTIDGGSANQIGLKP